MEHFVENFNGFVALRTLSIFVLEIFPFNMGKEILAHRGKKRLEVPTKQWACTWHVAAGKASQVDDPGTGPPGHWWYGGMHACPPNINQPAWQMARQTVGLDP